MIYEQANSVKELASGVMEVLERLEILCPECGGTGEDSDGRYKEKVNIIRCSTCNGKGKITYSYTPQVGEWIITLTKEVWLFTHTTKGEFGIEYWMRNKKGEESYHTEWGMKNQATPILPWEEIEKVLQKAGYERVLFDMSWKSDGEVRARLINQITQWKSIWSEGNSRTRAVYGAVLELRKEIE